MRVTTTSVGTGWVESGDLSEESAARVVVDVIELPNRPDAKWSKLPLQESARRCREMSKCGEADP